MNWQNFDQKIFDKLYNSFLNQGIGNSIFTFLAIYLIYTIPIILVFLWFWSKDSKKVAFKSFFAGVVAWLGISNTIGAFYFRPRPFVAQAGVKEIIFHRPDRSFPSDHAAFIFGLAFSLWFLGYRKLSIAIFVISLIISVARVFAGVHYLGDILSGFIIGLVCAFLIWLLDKPLDIIFKPVLTLTKKMRLS